MQTVVTNQETKSLTLINVLSVVIPIAVAVILGIPFKLDFGTWTKNLPHFVGAINALTSVALIAGLVFIKLKKVNLHRAMMTTAFTLGGLFLVCYVIYHITNPSTKFGGDDVWRYVYYAILISHILLSLIVLPLVLRAMYFAVTKQFARHKAITKYAYPIWLYVSITGVMAYAMISPYYK